MNARDAIKQTATATSSTVFNVLSGTAETGYLTFKQGFLVPSAAQYASAVSHRHVPVRVDLTSGASSGKWLTAYATLDRDAGDTTLTITLVRVLASSDYNATTRVFDTPAISAGNTAIISVVPIGRSLLTLAPPPVGAPAAIAVVGNVGASSLGVLGESAYASGSNAFALGYNAQAANDGAMAIGTQAKAQKHYSVAIGGNSGETALPFELAAVNASPIWMIQESATPTQLWLARSLHCWTAQTTDATATAMTHYHPETLDVNGNSTEISSTSTYPCYSGLTRFEGRLTAVEPATGDMKQWTLAWTCKTPFDSSTTTIWDALDKTVLGADAGAAAWDVDVTVDTVNNTCSIEVTGEAAKTLVWTYTGDIHLHAVFV